MTFNSDELRAKIKDLCRERDGLLAMINTGHTYLKPQLEEVLNELKELESNVL